jgi:hypothetical protein
MGLKDCDRPGNAGLTLNFKPANQTKMKLGLPGIFFPWHDARQYKLELNTLLCQSIRQYLLLAKLHSVIENSKPENFDLVKFKSEKRVVQITVHMCLHRDGRQKYLLLLLVDNSVYCCEKSNT